MAKNDNVIWQRPSNCICDYVQNVNESNELTIVRVINSLCPEHGELVEVFNYLEKVVTDYLKTVPGGDKISSVMARRILHALVPALLSDETLTKLLKTKVVPTEVQVEKPSTAKKK